MKTFENLPTLRDAALKLKELNLYFGRCASPFLSHPTSKDELFGRTNMGDSIVYFMDGYSSVAFYLPHARALIICPRVWNNQDWCQLETVTWPNNFVFQRPH